MVHKSLNYSGPPARRCVTTKFEFFKVDVSEHKWIKINDVGDVALFVGEKSARSVSASGFGCRLKVFGQHHERHRYEAHVPNIHMITSRMCCCLIHCIHIKIPYFHMSCFISNIQYCSLSFTLQNKISQLILHSYIKYRMRI